MSGGQWSRGGPPPVAVAVVVAFVQVIGSAGAARGQHHASLTPIAVALLLVGPAAIAGLRRRPLAPVAVSIAAAVTYALLDFPIGPLFVAPVAALWLEFIRSRHDRRDAIRRENALARDRQATEERVAIARELHDVIGHSLSLINVHAGVALHLLEDHPENARPALTTIKAVSHDALEEVRLVLDTLRGPGNAATRAPAPTLADVDALIAQSEQDTTRFDLTVDGVRGHLPVAVDAAGYRVVQEAMTNVRRHAQAAHALVKIGYDAASVSVHVTDDGGGSSAPEGSGLVGMRERVGALGGTFRAGSRNGGGFEVFARIPWQTMVSEDS
jgi:signal transduction histidine kinase